MGGLLLWIGVVLLPGCDGCRARGRDDSGGGVGGDTGQPMGPCSNDQGSGYVDLTSLPTTRYGDLAIRACRYWEPTAVGIQAAPTEGASGLLYVGGELSQETGGDGFSGDVIQLRLTAATTGVVLESDLREAMVRPDHCGDMLGSYVADVTDVDMDGIPDLVLGSGAGKESQADGMCTENWPPSYNVGAWVVPGPVEGDIVAEEVGWFAGYPWDQISFWQGIPVVLGDVTGDSRPDLALPLRGEGLGSPGTGEVALLPGPFESGDHVDLSEHELVFSGGQTPSWLMATVSGAYDANGDGVSDLAMSQCYQGPFPAVVVFLGPLFTAAEQEDAEVVVGTPDTPCTEKAEWWDLYGYWGQPLLNGGDMDGDGRDELVVGAFDRNVEGDVNAGLVWILGDAPPEGVSDIDNLATARVVGTQAEAFAGWPMASGGDLDGDGHSDLVVGSSSLWSSAYTPPNLNPGTWLHYGPLSGTIGYDTGSMVHSKRADLMTSRGDLDGDSIDDLVMTDRDIVDDDWITDGVMMGNAVHVWLSGQSLEFPRPWAPARD